ncbi:hypothetical protein AYX14_06273 [Cryptococcus neoformans]|nr:hypothetical protein AYX14_06273 [Cryptococcus neoformans var. grubii]
MTSLDNFHVIVDKTLESLPILAKPDDWPQYNRKLRLSLFTLGLPRLLDAGIATPPSPTRMVTSPDTSPSTAPAGVPTPSPPSSPMPYDSILESKDCIIAGAILLRLDPSIHETFVPIALDGSGNYTHRLYLALSRSFGYHDPHHVYVKVKEFFEMECGEGDDVVAWMRRLGTMRRQLEEVKMDWENLHVNALLHGLPPRFHHWRNEQFGGTAHKAAADIELAVTNIDAAASHSVSSSPAAFAVSVCRSDETLAAFYTKLSRKGRQPSTEHPCVRCGSPDHWVSRMCDVVEAPGKARESEEGLG